MIDAGGGRSTLAEGVEMGGSRRGWDPRADEAGTSQLLRATAERAIAYRAGIRARRVGARPGLTADELRARLGGPLPDAGEDPASVVDRLVEDVDDGLVAMTSPRYFGFVVGGSVPAALATDWLVSTWDQNVFAYLSTPAASIVEEVAAAWLVDLLGLPPTTSVGFATGATMANFTALAAARHAVLRAAGWDVEEDGLIGAPPVHVVVGEGVHASMVIALRLAGFGRRRGRRVAADGEGAMRATDLRRTLAELPPGPTIVAAQAGEVNTGAFDPLDEIADAVRERPGAWLHVDGAFGLWAAASPELRHLARGIERADSWATDAHKWLNVPYDTGVVFVRDAAAHRAAMGVSAAYLPPAPGDERDPFDYVPEMSRRGRGLVVYAALRSLGRQGVAALVESSCAVARRMADRLARSGRVEVLNEVVLNQILVRFGDSDETTREVIRRVQEGGTAWAGGTTWQGRLAMRISVSNWATTADDGDRSVEAILAALAATDEADRR
jgi:glutamate/tyrosine decarboxylase-like PLP-dependent enzyme